MQEGTSLLPDQNDTTGTLEIIDMLCTVTEQLCEIIRKQAEVTRQADIQDAVLKELEKQLRKAKGQMGSVGFKIRRMNEKDQN